MFLSLTYFLNFSLDLSPICVISTISLHFTKEMLPSATLGLVILSAMACKGKFNNVVKLLNQSIPVDLEAFLALTKFCSNPKTLEDLKKLKDFFPCLPFHADLWTINFLLEMFSALGSMVDTQSCS